MDQSILIVEDNDRAAAALDALLARRGYRTRRAKEGMAALDLILASPPAVVLLDLKPPRQNGVELLKKLRRTPATRNLPVIVITGAYKGQKNARAARSLGIDTYLEKPFRASDLLQPLKRILDKAVAGAAPMTIDRHLRRAFIEGFSGSYLLQCADGNRELFFVNGSPCALSPGFSHRDFGDYLHHRGLVSEDESHHYCNQGSRHPHSLVQMGCLRFENLLQEKQDYLYQELLGAFALPPMPAETRPLPFPAEIHLVTVNVPQLIHQGFKLSKQSTDHARLLEDRGSRFVAPTEDYFRYINFFNFDEDERRLLTLLDGTCSLSHCLNDKEHLTAQIYALQTLGMIRLHRTPVPAKAPVALPVRTFFNQILDDSAADEEPLENFSDLVDEAEQGSEVPLPDPEGEIDLQDQTSLSNRVIAAFEALDGKNHYEIFDMTQQDFAFGTLQQRYFELTNELGPQILMHLSGEVSTKAQEILEKVTAAYNTLSNVVKKERYDELLAADTNGVQQQKDKHFQAKVHFHSGQVFLEMEEWNAAELAFQDACHIDPDNGDFLAHRAWAIYRNPKNAPSPAILEKAQQMLNRALSYKKSPQAHAFKGWMLLKQGQELHAEAEFTRALKLDARQLHARQGMKRIEENREKNKKGLFWRIFG